MASKIETYDVGIIGSGCAGSILARILNRLGYRVLLLEKGTHPRIALGESTTPLANLVLERLARRYDLPDLHALSSHGRMQNGLPHLKHGLKRGFSFYRHPRGEPFHNGEANEARLLVAASPDEHNADTHWWRADIDHHLVEQARNEGVTFRDQTRIDEIRVSRQLVRLSGESRKRPVKYRAGFVIDGSGPAGVLPQALGLKRAPVNLSTALLFAHFESPEPWFQYAREAGAQMPSGPYRDDDAAIHHLLDRAWMYALPFAHGTTSAGIVLDRHPHRPILETARRSPAEAWNRLLAAYPTLAAQFAAARPDGEIRLIENLPYRLSRAAGRRYFLLPHSYAFFDPMFSTGIAWSLLVIERLAAWFEQGARGNESEVARSYHRTLAQEADQIERLIRLAYRALGNFDLFTHITFLYFAVVSFNEVQQRLNELSVPESGFLGAGDLAVIKLFRRAEQNFPDTHEADPSKLERFKDWIRQQIASINIAGLADDSRRNLYPLDLDLLVERAHLLGMNRAELLQSLPKLRGDTLPI